MNAALIRFHARFVKIKHSRWQVFSSPAEKFGQNYGAIQYFMKVTLYLGIGANLSIRVDIFDSNEKAYDRECYMNTNILKRVFPHEFGLWCHI